MSLRIDTAELITDAYVIGDVGLGVLGSDVPSTGEHGPSFLYNDLVLPDDAAKEIRGLIVTPPSAGRFYAWEDGSFSLVDAPDGEYTFTYRLFVDGADLGTATAIIEIGLASSGSLSGAAVLDGVSANGAISSMASDLAGEAVLSSVQTSGQMVGLIVLGSLAGSARKSYPTRRNVQTATR